MFKSLAPTFRLRLAMENAFEQAHDFVVENCSFGTSEVSSHIFEIEC
jgi:hypothetical protein